MVDGGRESDFVEQMEERAKETAAFIREELDTDIVSVGVCVGV
jgi:hypothetical protein